MCCQIHALPLEAPSLMISKSEATRFSLTISESTGVVLADESIGLLWEQFW